jgi:hypothetical protein
VVLMAIGVILALRMKPEDKFSVPEAPAAGALQVSEQAPASAVVSK